MTGRETRRLGEGQVREPPGEFQRGDQVLVGPLLPPGAPDQLEVILEAAQVSPGGGRQVVPDALDVVKASRRPLVGREAVERDDPVHVDHQERRLSV